MQTRDIQYVIAIADTGSFSKAAESLFISQSALSQSIQRLEAELGVTLFHRARKTTLTFAGEEFVRDGREILQRTKQLQKKMNDIKELKTGVLKIGISQFYGRYYFSSLITPFRAAYPHVQLKLYEEISASLERMLAEGELDCAIFSLPLSSPLLEAIPLFQEDILLAVPSTHPLAENYPQALPHFPYIDLSRVREDPFILFPEGQRMRTIVMDICLHVGFTPSIQFESRSAETIHMLIQNGMGVGFIPQAVLSTTQPDVSKCVYFRVPDMLARRTFVIAHAKDGYLSQAAKAFIQIAQTHPPLLEPENR